MKTSIVLLVLIVFNTSALFSVTIAGFIKSINPWLLIGVEVVLVICYLINSIITETREAMVVDCNHLNLLVTKHKK